MTTTVCRPADKMPATATAGWHYDATTFPAGQHKTWEQEGQQADVYARHTGFFALDVDAYKDGYTEAWEASATRKVLGARATRPYVSRGTGGSRRYLIYCTPEQAAEWWPVACRTSWGEIRSSGLAPSPGAVHPSGDLYKLGSGPDQLAYPDGKTVRTNVLRFTPELKAALEADGARGKDERPDLLVTAVEIPEDGDRECPVARDWLDRQDFTGATVTGERAHSACVYIKRMASEGHFVAGIRDEVLAALDTSAVEWDDMWSRVSTGEQVTHGMLDCCPRGAWAKVSERISSRSSLVTGQAHTPYMSQTAPGATQVPSSRFKRVKVSDIAPERIAWLWEPYVPKGMLTLLAGYEKSGKSTIAAHIVAKVTRAGGHVLMVATEDSWAHVLRPRLQIAGAVLDLIEVLEPADGTPELTFPDDCEALESEIQATGAVLVVLDPMLSRVADRFDTHKDAEVRSALEPLTKVLERTGCAALGLMHFNKNGSSHNVLDRLMASKAFSAVARSILATAPHPDDPEIRVMAHAACNVAQEGLALPYRVTSAGFMVQGGTFFSSKVEFLSPMEQFNLGAAFEPRKAEKKSAVEGAADFVRDYLESHGGAAFKEDIIREGVGATHSIRALNDCKFLVPAEASQVVGEQRRWAWHTPGMSMAEIIRTLDPRPGASSEAA
jgi:hypothetical protein